LTVCGHGRLQQRDCLLIAPPTPGETGVVRSVDLLSRGPLVITFFRGHW